MTDEDLRMPLKRNPALSVGDSGPVASVERRPRNEPLAAKEVQGQAGGRVLVVVTSFRKYDCDDDGLCEKYIIDLLRYAGILSGDSQKHCKIETSFRKAKKGETERTEIDIYELNT
jgi:hypothetical protein